MTLFYFLDNWFWIGIGPPTISSLLPSPRFQFPSKTKSFLEKFTIVEKKRQRKLVRPF